jgi:hypothetical protein
MSCPFHDRLLSAGFTIAYLAAMSALLLSEVGRLAPVRTVILLYGCAPAFALGCTLLLIARVRPIVDDAALTDARQP